MNAWNGGYSNSNNIPKMPYFDDDLLSDDDTIYPSRTDLDAINTPLCDDVFAKHIAKYDTKPSPKRRSKPKLKSPPPSVYKPPSVDRPKLGEHVPPSPARSTIEVSPGVFLPLFGSFETRRAVLKNHLSNCHCFVCDTGLYTIDLATSVVCPGCRIIWPLDNPRFDEPSVGLGLTESDRRDILLQASNSQSANQRRYS